MKRTIMSVLLILFMAVSMLVPIGAKPQEAKAASSFTVRTSMPTLTDKNAKWYFSDTNRFWAAGRLAPDFKKYKGIMDDGVTSGYVWGNCTWWAYSRASEIMGEPMNPGVRGNAGEWYNANKNGKYYPYGSTPKVGAIVVYRTHVAFIEKIVNGQIYVSESGWQTKTYGPKSTDDFFFHYGIPWNRYEKPQGYIYVTDKKSVDAETVKVDYSVKVSVSDLRMRSGPGTGYSILGKVAKGTHKLSATTKDGEWGKLASNGSWIFLDYTTKVSSSGSSKSTNNKLKGLSVSGYKISPTFKDTTTTYSLTVPNNVSSVTINASKAQKDAKVSGTGKVSLATGLNKKSVVVTAESGAKKTYTLKITRAQPSKSTNNKLKGLSVSGYKISPEFKDTTTAYSLTVPSNVSAVTINASKAQEDAKVSGDGKVKLATGLNTKSVVVTAESGAKKTYTLKITRAKASLNTNNKLKGLSVSGYKLSPAFKDTTTVYSLTVPSNVSSVTINASRAQKDAKVSGDGKVSLATGLNKKSVVVTAQNGVKKTYTLKITRTKPSMSTNNKLKALSVSGYKLSPAFKDTTTVYSLTVPSNVSSVTINASKAQADAKISGSGKVSLATGLNTKSVVVTAENGAKKTYTLKITRSKSSKVKIEVDQLNMRSGPGTSYKSKGYAKKGTYTITMQQNGWGKLSTNGYWIKLSYTKAVSDKEDDNGGSSSAKAYKVKVDVDSLNMRSGPGTSYTSKGKIKKGTYTITKTSNGWGKLKTNGYWIKLSYTTKVK